MAWSQTDVDNLKQAIADGRGARSMTFSDQSVTFNSIDDMLKLLSVMQAQVSAGSGGSRTRYGATSKGI